MNVLAAFPPLFGSASFVPASMVVGDRMEMSTHVILSANFSVVWSKSVVNQNQQHQAVKKKVTAK